MVLVNGADGTLTPGRCHSWMGPGTCGSVELIKTGKTTHPPCIEECLTNKIPMDKRNTFNPTNKISMKQFCLVVFGHFVSVFFKFCEDIHFCCSINLFQGFWVQLGLAFLFE